MTEIFAANIEENPDRMVYERMITRLPPEEQNRIGRFRLLNDRKRALLGAVLIRSLLCSRTGLKEEQLLLSRGAYGKPFLKGAEDIHFNLAHSGKWVVCILGNSEAGIDVEKMEPIDIRLGKYFFSSLEYAALTELSRERQLNRFYELWTLKESYMKAIGKGLAIPLDSFSVVLEKEEIRLEAAAGGSFSFKQYRIEKGYKLAACSKEKPLPDMVNIISVQSMMR